METIESILARASATPVVADILKYLTAADKMPAMEAKVLDTAGQFSRNTVFGNELPANGLLELDKFTMYTNPVSAASTMAHELTHAARAAIDTQALYAKHGETPESQRLASGAGKLLHNKNREGRYTKEYRGPRAIAPDWTAKNQDYRATESELQSFGIGNAATGIPSHYPAPRHVDATAATEFEILLDLALRQLKAEPQASKATK